MLLSPRRRTLALIAACASIGLVGTTATWTAEATPAAPTGSSLTGSRVVGVTHNSFTVRFDSQGAGWKYRLYASTNKADVYYDNLPSAPPYRTALLAKTKLTLSNLPYRTKPYWWRVQAYKNSSKRTGDMLSVGLRPKRPTGLTANHVASQGLSLSWGGDPSNGWQVQQAKDAGFSTGVKTYTIRGLGRQFTPYGLTTGTTYYFRVRAANGGTKSPWTPGVSGRVLAQEQQVLVGSFNIHSENASNNTSVPSWKNRRDAVVASVRRGGPPEVIAIQEGDGWVGGTCSARQVDDLANRLGTKWKVAHTEPIPCKEHPWKRTGTYVIYDDSAYRAVGVAGNWKVSTGKTSNVIFVAYQELENRSTGARMLFVSVHLQPGQTAATDKERQQETQNLLADVAGLGLGLPVVYAGDFNSHDRRPFDGPGVEMRKADVADAWFVAPKRVRSAYNSANAYLRKPPRTSTSIDHIMGAPGVSMQTWELEMKLKDGRYVGVIPSDHNLLIGKVRFPY
jgi:endonuclease/exonuclease/phosphatase family metal-dependent hydrolase